MYKEYLLAAIMIVYFISVFGGMALEQHGKSQCRIAYAQSTKTVEEINQLCK